MGPRPVSPQRTSVWAAHVEMGQCVKNRELPLTRQNYCQENTYTYSHALLCMHLRIVSVRATVFSNRVSVVLRFCCRFCGSVNNQPLMFNRQPFCEGLEKWSRFNEWLRNRKWVSDVGCGWPLLRVGERPTHPVSQSTPASCDLSLENIPSALLKQIYGWKRYSQYEWTCLCGEFGNAVWWWDSWVKLKPQLNTQQALKDE